MGNEKCFVDFEFELICWSCGCGGAVSSRLELLMRNLLNLTCLANLIVHHDKMVIGELGCYPVTCAQLDLSNIYFYFPPVNRRRHKQFLEKCACLQRLLPLGLGLGLCRTWERQSNAPTLTPSCLRYSIMSDSTASRCKTLNICEGMHGRRTRISRRWAWQYALLSQWRAGPPWLTTGR